MGLEELKTKVKKPSADSTWAPWFIVAGWVVLIIYWIWAFTLSSVIGNYFLFSKAERDAAISGSSLLETLNRIQTTASVLEPLKFVGITLIIVGISLLLIAILRMLKLRAEAMRLALTARKDK